MNVLHIVTLDEEYDKRLKECPYPEMGDLTAFIKEHGMQSGAPCVMLSLTVVNDYGEAVKVQTVASGQNIIGLAAAIQGVMRR